MSQAALPSAISKQDLELISIAVEAADDKKAERISLIDLSDRSSFAQAIMICHGSSDTHVKAIREAINQAMRNAGERALGIEGESLNQWVLMDFAFLVIHIFYEPLRDFYDIEGLWSDCPNIDLSTLPKASNGDDKKEVLP